MRGGGQFLLRLPKDTEAEEKLHRVRAELEQQLYRETQSELGLTLAWASSVQEALEQKEREKRRLWSATVTRPGSWHIEALSLKSLAPQPCGICRRRAGTKTLHDGEEEIPACPRCHDDTAIGRQLPTVAQIELCGSGGGAFQLLGRGLRFNSPTPAGDAQLLQTPRLHVPPDMTFKDIAAKAEGDNLLAVLKVDVDGMGAKLAEMRGNLDGLKKFSRTLDDFFSRRVQQWLDQEPWSWIYTIYSGGDDLLMVGPWNLMLDFAGEVHSDFADGPGRQYGLTFSASIALVNYRVPIRDSVEQADDLLEWAKGRRQPAFGRAKPDSSKPAGDAAASAKDRCAALGWVWKWERHAAILQQAKELRAWIDQGTCPRSMAHRLLSLANRRDPLRTAHWAYEVGRNFPKHGAASPEAREFRAWGERVLAEMLEDPVAARELAVQLRYALIATRPRREQP